MAQQDGVNRASLIDTKAAYQRPLRQRGYFACNTYSTVAPLYNNPPVNPTTFYFVCNFAATCTATNETAATRQTNHGFAQCAVQRSRKKAGRRPGRFSGLDCNNRSHRYHGSTHFQDGNNKHKKKGGRKPHTWKAV